MCDRPPRYPRRPRVWSEDVPCETTSTSTVENVHLADKKSLEAKLERKYILERFYDIGPVYANFGLAFMGFELFMVFFLPGAKHTGAVGFVFWLVFFGLCKYVMRYKGTDHGLYGKKLYETVLEVMIPIKDITQARNGSLASEEGRNAHAALVILAFYFIATLVLRLTATKYKKSPVWMVIMPLIAFRYPRFGIFSPGSEAFVFFVVMALGHVIGGMFDEMRWRYFLLMHEKELEIEKKAAELSKESRQRVMAMEILSSYEQSRWESTTETRVVEFHHSNSVPSRQLKRSSPPPRWT